MTRVSSLGQTQFLLQALLRNQAEVFEGQRQISTGKRISSFRQLGVESVTLLGARSLNSRTTSFQNIISRLEGRLSGNDVRLQGVLDLSRDLSIGLIETIALDDGTNLRSLVDSSFQFIASLLNTQLEGQFIFAGSSTSLAPVTSDDINDLIAAADAGDLFQNDQTPLIAEIAEGAIMEYGLLADDIAADIFASIKRIAEFDQGVDGPFSGNLTDNQRAFLESEIPLLDAAIDRAQDIQVRNGLRQARLETTNDQHLDTELFLVTFIADIEDSNVAEAITKLNLDQTALEASMLSLAQLGNLSLLNFI